MSTPKNLETIDHLIGPPIAKSNTAVWFANMASAIELGLISVQDLRINMHVTKGGDEFSLTLSVVMGRNLKKALVPEGPNVKKKAVCTKSRGCWLVEGHVGQCYCD